MGTKQRRRGPVSGFAFHSGISGNYFITDRYITAPNYNPPSQLSSTSTFRSSGRGGGYLEAIFRLSAGPRRPWGPLLLSSFQARVSLWTCDLMGEVLTPAALSPLLQWTDRMSHVWGYLKPRGYKQLLMHTHPQSETRTLLTRHNWARFESECEFTF